MKYYKNIKKSLIVFLSLTSTFHYGQVQENSELYKTIVLKDSLLFNVGFNSCDISQFENLLSNDLEFLHDKDGISNKKEFLYNLKNGLCGSPDKYQSRRALLKWSTEIYPLYKNDTIYGAIQNGAHRFYETLAGKEENFASSAKFSNVWLLENGHWKLTKSLSFDHQSSFKISSSISMFDDGNTIEKWLISKNIPTLGIGIINNGQLQQVKVFGQLNNQKSAPYNTIFNVASLAKPVTAMVALKLVSSGKWDLDEPIYNYWIDPEIASDPRSMVLTTRHILSHQSGFPNWRYSNEANKLAFQFSPGTKYQYSGEGMEYLRKALERKFNKSLNELAAELIFEPLSMDDTSYTWNSNIDEARFAKGYDNQGNSYKTVRNKTPNGADDLLTTIEDYGKLLVSVMNSEGITENLFTDMTTHQVESTKGKHFGLGFEIYDFKDGQYALSHGGADKGAQAIFFIFPETKNGLIIFTNVDDGYKVYEKLLLHYLGMKGEEVMAIETSD